MLLSNEIIQEYFALLLTSIKFLFIIDKEFAWNLFQGRFPRSVSITGTVPIGWHCKRRPRIWPQIIEHSHYYGSSTEGCTSTTNFRPVPDEFLP